VEARSFRHLAPSGKRILLLERGDWLTREPQNWLAQDVFVDNRYVSPDTWYDARGKAFQPQVHYFVGGSTKLYGAALYRLREEDFGEVRHHDGISPAWPIGYDEMEPYYTLAEQMYRVHGERGEDPTEPPASAPYPFPAVSHEPRIQQLSDDLVAIGHHPFHAPCGIMLDEHNMPYSACVRCPDCDGFPCLVHAKSRLGRARRATGARAPERDAADQRDRSGAQYKSAGTAVTEVRGSNAMVLARPSPPTSWWSRAARSNSAKLLLTSANDAHTEGPRQRVRPGRSQLHVSQQPGGARALQGREPDGVQKTLGLNDFYSATTTPNTRSGTSKWSASRSPRCSAARSRSRRSSRRSGLSSAWRGTAIDFWLSTRTCPARKPVNLDRNGNIKLSYTPNNESAQARALREAQVAARPWT
jgi:hypothetical protein